MIKQSNWGKVGVVLAIGGFVVMAVAMLFDGHGYFDVEPVDAPIVQEVPPAVENFIVDVSTLYKGERRYGKGVIIEREGEVFILTSQMIFVEGYESIMVGGGDWFAGGEIITTSEKCGLVALRTVPELHGGFPLNDAPNIPMQTDSVAIGIGMANVRTIRYLTPDWFLITGVDENYVGAPLVNGGEITGLIIGQNSTNITQAICVGNSTINSFVDQVLLLRMSGPPSI